MCVRLFVFLIALEQERERERRAVRDGVEILLLALTTRKISPVCTCVGRVQVRDIVHIDGWIVCLSGLFFFFSLFSIFFFIFGSLFFKDSFGTFLLPFLFCASPLHVVFVERERAGSSRRVQRVN